MTYDATYLLHNELYINETSLNQCKGSREDVNVKGLDRYYTPYLIFTKKRLSITLIMNKNYLWTYFVKEEWFTLM